MLIPPSISVVGKGEHMLLRDCIERTFNVRGCVARMNIYAQGDVETVYVEFNEVGDSAKLRRMKAALMRDKVKVEQFVLRPQLLVS
jgi:hypothetical protein